MYALKIHACCKSLAHPLIKVNIQAVLCHMPTHDYCNAAMTILVDVPALKALLRNFKIVSFYFSTLLIGRLGGVQCLYRVMQRHR